MIIFPASHRPFPVSNSGRTCYAFQWVGQAFHTCDNCGNPYWRHSHYLTVRANPSGFGGKPFRKIITEEEAIACYYKWGS